MNIFLCSSWSRGKAIYVARNAKDNLVSYYYFDLMNQTQPEPGPFGGYIHKFMQGERKYISLCVLIPILSHQ